VKLYFEEKIGLYRVKLYFERKKIGFPRVKVYFEKKKNFEVI